MTTPTAAFEQVPQRDDVQKHELRLPYASLPRFGDAVVWYLNASRQEGHLCGHAPGARPVVKTRAGYTFALSTFDEVRWKDPSQRNGPAWDVLEGDARIMRPTALEYSEFVRLLSQPIPPGPTYFELIEEIWSRGFEVFVVGGTVRDVIAAKATNDVDLVTTMPLERSAPLLKSMYRRDPQIHGINGYVRLGGTPASGDPFIDLKSFVCADPGTDQAIFGADFRADIVHRDFACNAVYYDPINNVLIDPTGHGVTDAETKTLNVICDFSRPAYHRGQVAIRFVKFRSRGFSASEATLDNVRKQFVPGISAMRRSDLIAYLHRQVFGKVKTNEREAAAVGLKNAVCELCGEQAWEDLFAPIVDLIPAGEVE